MIAFVKSHKLGVTIACVAVILFGAIAATVISRHYAGPAAEIVPSGRIHDAGVFGEDIVVHDSTEGEIVIAAASHAVSAEDSPMTDDITPAIMPSIARANVVADPEAIWTADAYAGNHTLVKKALMQNGSIGVLTIPKLMLSVNVYESPDNMEAMSKGIAHFPSTSAWDGNVAMSAHNINMDGSAGYFLNLYTLEKGDAITYMTALGERSYTVESVTAIAASDWSPLGYTDDHRLTLITCISGQPDKRLAVTALEAAQ